jgi:hypothetical protein
MTPETMSVVPFVVTATPAGLRLGNSVHLAVMDPQHPAKMVNTFGSSWHVFTLRLTTTVPLATEPPDNLTLAPEIGPEPELNTVLPKT